MPYPADIYRILIASPSDVKDEREAVRQAIRRWNQTNSVSRGVYLSPILWEVDSAAEMSAGDGFDPQQLINRQLVDDCDILIAFFWGRVGTITGRYPSGTVEEIEKFRSTQRPVQLYFCTRGYTSNQHTLEDFNKVAMLREQYQKDSITLDFRTPQDLADECDRGSGADFEDAG